MFLKGHYQNAYVTHDLDRAMERLSDRFGLKEYIVLDLEMTLKTNQGEKPASVKVAFIWVGGLQIELIQPRTGFVDHYLRFLPSDRSDPALRFHHIAVRRDDLTSMRAEIAALNLPVAFEGEVPGLTYVYLDATATLGHYLEYVWASPAGWEMMRWPNERPVL